MNYTDPQNWDDAANLLPLLSASDLDDLAEDIKINGLLNPVILHDGKVLDGRNRALACQKVGVTPHFATWEPNGTSPITWVISQNLRRRHLDAGQRAAVPVDARPMLAAEAKRNQQEAGKRFGNGKVASVKMTKPIDSRERVASQFDVSQGYVYAAQKIKDKDEKVFQQVKSGSLSIPDAQKALGFKQSVQAMVSADSNEWYTPENYVKAVKSVLGAIDLDPASCEMADKFIRASKFYTQEDDGLKHKWTGRVFLNPPYGDVGPKFSAKLIREYEAGHVTEAILLVNSHCTDSKWFKPLFEYVLCFTDHRSRFWNQDGIGSAPTHGSVLAYLGPHKDKFAEVFSHFGAVVVPYKQ